MTRRQQGSWIGADKSTFPFGWVRLFCIKPIAQFSKTGCDCTTFLSSSVTVGRSAMSLIDLAALFNAAGDSDAVREGIQAFVEEMLIEPEKLGEEEAVAKRAFAKVLTASGGVDVARKSLDAVHAEHEIMNESTSDEDARKFEVQVQEA